MEPCGLGHCFRPAWMQRFASPFWFLLVYGVLGTTQAMAFIYFVATLTTLEKRFKIPSKTTGILMSGNEISQIILSLVLSYYGGQGNRPRWIACGVSFAALSCFILALPHIVYGAGPDALALTAEYGAELNASSLGHGQGIMEDLCKADNTGLDCNSDTSHATMPLVLIFLSQFVLGIGTTLYYALGQTYLDDNTKKDKTPLMLGFVLALRTVGPALGFMLGFACLSLYIDPSLTPVITKRDPRWLGAWWLGWVLLGFLKLLVAILISMFPRELPKCEDAVMKKKTSEEEPLRKTSIIVKSLNNDLYEKQGEAPNQTKPVTPITDESGFLPALKRLLQNKLLMCNNLAAVFYILGASGYITFLTKYMETQFQQSAAIANVFAGSAGISAMVLGFLISGIVISKYKPRTVYVLSWNVIVGFAYIASEIIFIFLGCPDNSLQKMLNDNGQFDLLSKCNANCTCSSKYNPVCHKESGTTFYSACHAGCTSMLKTVPTKAFTDCECTANLPSIIEIGTPSLGQDVLPGPCTSDCATVFYTFVILTFVMHLLTSSGKIGNILVTYRCVRVEDKSFAQGLTLLMVSLLAFIPGPIMYGAIIDSSCLVWDESCHHKGNCWLYHKDNFRLYLNSTAATLTVVGVALDCVVCLLGKSLELYEYAEDKRIEDTEKKILKTDVIK